MGRQLGCFVASQGAKGSWWASRWQARGLLWPLGRQGNRVWHSGQAVAPRQSMPRLGMGSIPASWVKGSRVGRVREERNRMKPLPA